MCDIYKYLILRKIKSHHWNLIFKNVVEQIGVEFAKEISGKSSPLRKGEKKIIKEIGNRKDELKTCVSGREIKSLYNSFDGHIIRRGIHFRIPFSTITILDTVVRLCEENGTLKKRCTDYCEENKIVEELRLYRDVLLNQYFTQIIVHYNKSLLNDNEKAIKLYNNLNTYIKKIS